MTEMPYLCWAFLYTSTGVNSYQQNDHGNHAENADVHVHSLPGKTAEVTFIPIERGVFRFYCTVPGHKESGMVGFAKVS